MNSTDRPAGTPSPPQIERRLGAFTGTLLIAANMIGVGVFTTTGYMVAGIQNGPAILLAWLLGGIAALCGALCYAELGAALPRNGGEYQLLSHAFHPAIGFAAGWSSLIVGFSAPLALYANAFGTHLKTVFPAVQPMIAGAVLIVVCGAVHAFHVTGGSRFHNAFTLGKLFLILAFIGTGAVWGGVGRIRSESVQGFGPAVVSTIFAVNLVYVSFSYSGWNATAYVAGEIKRPERNLPIAVAAGTILVALLYLGLNATFLASASAEALTQKETIKEVGVVAARHLLGAQAGTLAALVISIGLISTVSAIMVTGPRVYEAMGNNFAALQWLTVRHADGGPLVAVAVQTILALLMLATATFETLLTYIGLTLSLFAVLTVIAVFVLRIRDPDMPRPYRTFGYPLTPLIFLALEGWMIAYTLRERPLTAAISAATVATGLAVWALVRVKGARPQASDSVAQ